MLRSSWYYSDGHCTKKYFCTICPLLLGIILWYFVAHLGYHSWDLFDNFHEVLYKCPWYYSNNHYTKKCFLAWPLCWGVILGVFFGPINGYVPPFLKNLEILYSCCWCYYGGLYAKKYVASLWISDIWRLFFCLFLSIFFKY